VPCEGVRGSVSQSGRENNQEKKKRRKKEKERSKRIRRAKYCETDKLSLRRSEDKNP